MANQTAIKFGYPVTLIREYKHWVVLLREQQVTLGSLVMCEKSDAVAFSALSDEAFKEMGIVIQDIERALGNTFKYKKINYLMLMMVDPNVHFHVIPRYSAPRSVGELTITDHGWPSAPQLGQSRDLNVEERDELCQYIKARWKNDAS